MKVLHLYKDYYPVLGGIENHIRILAQAQAAQGLDVTVLVTNPGRESCVAEVEGVRVIKAGRLFSLAGAPISLDFLAWLRRLEADVAHLHFPYPWAEVGNWLVGRVPATVITYHSDVVRQKGWLRLYEPLLRRLLKSADRILAASPNYVQTSPYLSRVADRCSVVPYGIDLKRFQIVASEAERTIRNQYSGSRLLFVGKFRYYKGLQYLLQAMSRIEALLLVVGEGPMGARWRRLSRELGVDGRVAFLGEVSDEVLPSYYAASDLFVLPSSHRSEAFGLVQIEAMASGTPVISTELGTGTSYVNVHGETGLVVPPRDPAALAEAINHLLDDGVLRERMAQKTRQRAQEFSAERMVQRVIQAYEDVLSG